MMELDPTLDPTPDTVAPPRESLSPARLQPVLRLVELGLERPLRVVQMADAVGLGVFHFSREFRRVLGASPYAYIRRRRIARASLLLAGSKLPIVDIARSVGFKTHAHFSGAFAKAVGMTPRNYRLRHSGSGASRQALAAAAQVQQPGA